MILLAASARGQSLDSLKQRADSLLRVRSTRLDSTYDRTNKRIDSVQQRLNGARNVNAGQLINKIKFDPRKDSSTRKLRADSLRASITHKRDSLKQLGKATEELDQRLAELNQLDISRATDADEKWKQFEQKLNQPLNNAEGKVNEKLALMNREGGEKANIPGQALLPDAELSLGEGKVNTLTLNQKINNPLTSIDNPMKEEMEGINKLKSEATQLKNNPQEQIDKLKQVDEVKAVESKLNDANQVTDKIQNYTEDAKSLSQGNLEEVKQLPKDLETEAAKRVEGINELQEKSGELKKYNEMVGKGNDPEALKSLAKDQALDLAKDHFAGKEEVLRAAVDKMNKLKTKYGDVTTLTDLKRAPNSMRGKPWIERIVPGFTMQIQKKNAWWIDINPVISYRVSGRWLAGAGWNERVSFSKWNKTIPLDRIYGARVFTSFTIKKGFSVRLEGEKMNTYVLAVPDQAESGSRIWVWSAFAGLKKEYTFMRGVVGNFQFLYNLYDDHDNSPYTDRFVVRFGFEFPLKKKVKKEKK